MILLKKYEPEKKEEVQKPIEPEKKGEVQKPNRIPFRLQN